MDEVLVLSYHNQSLQRRSPANDLLMALRSGPQSVILQTAHNSSVPQNFSASLGDNVYLLHISVVRIN